MRRFASVAATFSMCTTPLTFCCWSSKLHFSILYVLGSIKSFPNLSATTDPYWYSVLRDWFFLLTFIEDTLDDTAYSVPTKQPPAAQTLFSNKKKKRFSRFLPKRPFSLNFHLWTGAAPLTAVHSLSWLGAASSCQTIASPTGYNTHAVSCLQPQAHAS